MSAADIHELSKEELAAEYLRLQHEHDQLRRMIFGSKKERFVPSQPEEQLSLGLGEEPKQPEAEKEQITYTRRRKVDSLKLNGRLPIPKHLERRVIDLHPSDIDPKQHKCIGKEVCEELNYEPGKLYVNQYVRHKYLIEEEEQQKIVVAALPSRPIPKGIPGAGLLAQVIIDKFVDHLPLYRQVKRYEREGMKIPPSTLGDWVGSGCKLIEPVYEALTKEVLSSEYLQVDETPIKVLEKTKKGKSHRGYYWVYHNPLAKAVFFDYRKGRGREGPTELLKNFEGYLQCDGYQVYEQFDTGQITVLNCMAHARRMFEQALDNDLQRAQYVLQQIQLLYAVERVAREKALSFRDRYALRQEQAVPVLIRLEKWMKENYAQVTPKSPIGKAISYSLSRWEKLCMYTVDGGLEIDNNLVENAIRPNALGRKNYLFAGSHQAAQRSAMLYSLLGTCKMHGINPFVWLRDILCRIPEYPINRIHDLLPHHWKHKEWE